MNLLNLIIIRLLLVTKYLTIVTSFPLTHPQAQSGIDFEKSLYLLYQFGYIHPGTSSGNPISLINSPLRMLTPSDNGNLHGVALMRTPGKEVKDAVTAFQRRYHLPQTGRIDEETSKLLISPRCGNPDVEADAEEGRGKRVRRRVKRYLIGDDTMKWTKKRITWQIRSYPSHDLDRRRTHTVFQHTFNMWSQVADLDFEEEKDYSKPVDIIIEFGARKHGDSIPFDGPGMILAHAYYPTPIDVYSFSGDAHFDDEEKWSDGPSDEHRNLVNVAVHELGHSLGLGHSSIPSAIMYPYYITTWDSVKLDQDDIDGIQKLYGPAKPGKYIPTIPDLPEIPPLPPKPTHGEEKRRAFNLCNVSVDAIIQIRGRDLNIFKNEWQWRVTWSKTVTEWISYQLHDEPFHFKRYWTALPDDLPKIDAGIERLDSTIYMFAGSRFWLLKDNNHLMKGVPEDGLPLTVLGLPWSMPKIDTIFRWGYNNQLYIMAGHQYWKLDEFSGDFGFISSNNYPRDIDLVWRGVPTPVTAAFTGLHKRTYFLVGNQNYFFDNNVMRVRKGYPRPASLSMLGCISDS